MSLVRAWLNGQAKIRIDAGSCVEAVAHAHEAAKAPKQKGIKGGGEADTGKAHSLQPRFSGIFVALRQSMHRLGGYKVAEC